MGVYCTENKSKVPQILVRTFSGPKFALLSSPCDILAQEDLIREEHK